SIVSPNLSANTTNIAGSLFSQANATFLLQFFSNSAADSSGAYEGQSLIGVTILTTDPAGSTSFSVNLSAVVAPGSYVTATASYLTTTLLNSVLSPGDTSEFSLGIMAASANLFAVTNTLDSGPGSLRSAITLANQAQISSGSSPNQIVFQISASGPQ